MNPRVEKILKLPVYQRVIILCVFLLLIVGGFVYLVYMPKLDEYRGLQDRNRSLATKLEEDRRIARNLPKFKAEYEKMQGQLEAALTQLPNKKEIPTLLTNIASLAKENGLDVLSFRPAGESVKGFYAEVPVSLRLMGSFHELVLFFQDVGDLSRIVNVNNVTISQPKTSGGETTIQVNCTATTFRFVEGG